MSGAEAAFDAFKAFFTPKPLKKDPADKVDLDAVRKKIRGDKDVLRAVFERTSSKTPEKKDSSDGKVCYRQGAFDQNDPADLVWALINYTFTLLFI